MSIVIPISYALDGVQSGHRMMRCLHTKTINGVTVQCIKRFRVSRTEIPHEHVYPIPIVRPISDINSSQEAILHALSTMIAACNVSINASQNKAIQEFMCTCITAGQHLPNEKASNLVPSITRTKVTQEIIKEGELLKREALLPFTKMFVSMMVDATTLVHKRLLCIMLSPNNKSIDPIVYDTVPSPRLRIIDFHDIVLSTIEELAHSGIKIGAIVGDNCPTQVLALAHWSPSCIFKGHECSAIRGIRFFSCGVHSTALMLSDCLEKIDSLNRLASTLTELITAVNSSLAAEYIGHCPQPVSTRWLSRIDAIDWLLLHEESLKRFPMRDDIDLEPAIRRNLSNTFRFERFEEIRLLAKLIYPFYVMTLALEADSSTQAMIIPLTEQMKDYFLSIKDEFIFEDYPELIDSMIKCIDERFAMTYDVQLLFAACLTSIEGRAWFLTTIYNEEDRELYKRWSSRAFKKVNFKYSVSNHHVVFPGENEDVAPPSVEDDPLLALASETPLVNDDEANQNDEEGQNPEIPSPPSGLTTIYDSALHAIMQLCSDLEIDSTSIPSAFSSWLFDHEVDEHLWIHRDAHIADLWKTLSLRADMKIFARVCIRIVGVSASECPVERNFSLEKLILTRLRNRTSSVLLDARARIQRHYSKITEN